MKKIKKIFLRIQTYYKLKCQLRTLDQTFKSIMDRPIDDRLKDSVLLRLLGEIDEVQDKINNL